MTAIRRNGTLYRSAKRYRIVHHHRHISRRRCPAAQRCRRACPRRRCPLLPRRGAPPRARPPPACTACSCWSSCRPLRRGLHPPRAAPPSAAARLHTGSPSHYALHLPVYAALTRLYTRGSHRVSSLLWITECSPNAENKLSGLANKASYVKAPGATTFQVCMFALDQAKRGTTPIHLTALPN